MSCGATIVYELQVQPKVKSYSCAACFPSRDTEHDGFFEISPRKMQNGYPEESIYQMMAGLSLALGYTMLTRFLSKLALSILLLKKLVDIRSISSVDKTGTYELISKLLCLLVERWQLTTCSDFLNHKPFMAHISASPGGVLYIIASLDTWRQNHCQADWREDLCRHLSIWS